MRIAVEVMEGTGGYGFFVTLIPVDDYDLAGIMNPLLLIILPLLLVGVLPTWPYSSGWGYYPSGGFGLVLVILLILMLGRRA